MYNKFRSKIIGLQAVIIDRTGDKARCIVGTETETEVTSEG
jgi:hypothetical protein